MSTPSASPLPRRVQPDPLAKFPEEIRAAHARHLATGNTADLDTVVLAVVRDYVPKTVPLPADGSLPDHARLIADLGFDSLAIGETVFFLEDLFRVRITNAEIIKVRTVGELRNFVRQKLASQAPRKS
jgi:acyl carrier protein